MLHHHSQIFVYCTFSIIFFFVQRMLSKCWLIVDYVNIFWIFLLLYHKPLKWFRMKYETKKHIDFITLLHESLLKSLWKIWKSWKKSIFCQYSKSDFFKSIEYMMLIVSAGCNTPFWLLRNRISAHPHNGKTPHV